MITACLNCQKSFKPTRSNKNNPQKYCCYICSVEYKSKPKIINKCLNCGKETTNPKVCSRSCNAINQNTGRVMSEETKDKIGKSLEGYWNNLSIDDKETLRKSRQKPRKKKLKPKCIVCGKDISKNKTCMCKECYLQSDIAQQVWAHGRKHYNKGYVFSPYSNREIYMMSGLEIRYARWLNENKINWTKPQPIKYTLDGKQRKYFPDFLLIDTDEIIEIKGYWWNTDKIKMKSVIEQNPSLKIKIFTNKELTDIGA
jgi:hypothetical protein